MKKALKILIPVILVIAILVTACWFFLFYNRTLTVDLLLNGAVSMSSRGRYERAVTYYDLAWKLMPNDIDIPLNLAETYVAADNFTKAEYTLVSAISSNPDQAELYEALCRTYVAQDKLLDAVQMLDRITVPEVKEYLDALRPAAPAVLPESGYYTEYIEVQVQSPEDRVYVTTDGEYPSSDNDLYTDTLTMPSGESTIIALAVNDQGLVSTASVSGYTIGGVVEPVTLNDAAINEAVRQLLGLNASDTIMSDDLWSVTALQLPESVEDLSDLTHFTGLRSLSIQNVSGMDMSILAQMVSLQGLDLSGCTISSNTLEAIGSLTELRTLILDSCALTDISQFSSLTKIVDLDLSNNSITDISVLSLMLDLESVSLTNNPLESIAGLTTCSALKHVAITNCGITSIGPLAEKGELLSIHAANNQISDLTPLEHCTKLETLVVSNNLIENISVLGSLHDLKTFDGSTNTITAIPDFDEEKSTLVRFSANYNQIEDLSGLSGIDSLNYVELDYNLISDIHPLIDNYNLVKVDVWDNPIPDVAEAIKPFEESSIIVNYNPNFEVPEEEAEEEG